MDQVCSNKICLFTNYWRKQQKQQIKSINSLRKIMTRFIQLNYMMLTLNFVIFASAYILPLFYLKMRQKQSLGLPKLSFLYIVALAAITSLGLSLTASPIIAPTSRYINTSIVTLSTANSFGTGLAKLQPFTYTHVFPTVKANTNYEAGATIAKITYTFPSNRGMNYRLGIGTKTTSSVGVLIFANNPNSITLFVIYVLILQAGFLNFYFDYWSFTGNTGFKPGQTVSTTGVTSSSYLPATGTIFCSVIGLDVVAPPTLQIGLSIKATFLTSSIKMAVTSLASVSFDLNTIIILEFTFDNSQLQLIFPRARYNWGIMTDTSGTGASLKVVDTNNIVRSYNSILGITSFLTKDAKFNYNTFINPSLSLDANSSSVWSTLAFFYLIFQFQYCPDPTPYLMFSTKICYDICPMRYCSNNLIFQCTACPTVDCYYCGVNGSCIACNATLDYRYLNTTTMRCLPLPGYYESNLSQAAACVAANCLTCTSPTVCLSCYVGKYLTAAKTCVLCMVNCYNCSSASTCIQCNTNFVFVSTACVPNCSNVTNCNTCTANTTLVTCVTCQTGYSLLNNSCIQVCGDGMLMTPQLCDDGNVAPNDGCSSTCTIETGFFCNNSVVPTLCAHCITNCDNCTNAAVCTLCSVGYVLTANGSCTADCSVIANCSSCTYTSASATTNCLSCQTGYTVQSNVCVTQCGDGVRVNPQGCDDGLLANGDGCSSNCTVESGFFCADTYPNASVCGKCIDFCAVCSNNSTCTTCVAGYIDNVTVCFIDCSPIANCSACTYNGSTVCASCTLGYGLSNPTNSCDPKCGDGVRVNPQGCDDGGNSSGDGCSSNCTVESGYFCIDTYPNASVCSQCIAFCTVCANNATCTTCNVGYAFNSTACAIDCSPIANCSSCVYSGSILCTACSLGYQLNNSTFACDTKCGDGVRVNPEGCDDGLLANGDGCSSNCTVESGFFCVDTYPNASVCGVCIAFCSVCSDNSTCVTCNAGYTNNNVSCTIDCTSIFNCSSCIYSGYVVCTTCALGYELNNASNTCTSKCGDGVRVNPEGCDDGLLANGDGCSSNCTVESGFFCVDTYPNASVCGMCIAFCSVCSDNSTCVTCKTGYTPNTTACTIDCSSVVNCASCIYNASVQCTQCAPGYHLSLNNSCGPKCGDGFRNANESCDDNNTANNDGCSSVCAFQAGFYCSDIAVVGGVQSNCSLCLPFCVSCVNGSACDQCSAYYDYSAANASCVINCTSIVNCATCNYAGSLVCASCALGYYVSSNSCKSKCGDGILVVEQGCDDGNLNNGDGCSSACVAQPSFFCSNITVNGSLMTNCTKCLLNCADCTPDVNDCAQCEPGYLYFFGSSASCEANCFVFVDCATCTPAHCLTCNPGSTLNSNFNCTPICGDGIVLYDQPCDDNNTVSYDGCSSTCQIEANFGCKKINDVSVCSLLTWSIDLVSILKAPDANSISVQYQVNPSTLAAFSNLSWSSIVYQQSNLSLSFTGFNYDASTGQLTVSADYAQTLNNEVLQIGFNFPATAPFDLIGNTANTSTVLVSDNNLSLEVYSADAYSNSKVLEYIATATSIVALALFLLGYFSGKLIGLECVTVFQLTFLSLLTFENLSPSFGALSKLSYSCGYNVKNLQGSGVKVSRRFNPVNLSEPFLSNYNLTVALFLVPLLISLILYLVNRCKYEGKHEKLIKYSGLLRGEHSFYGLMFSAYQIVLALGIEFGHSGAGMMGLAIGAVLTLTLVVYGGLLHKFPAFFGEFTEEFAQDSFLQSHYYCLLVLERVLTAAALLMIGINPQAAIVLVLLLTQISMVLLKKPYKGEGAWLRPFLNLLISAIITLIFMLNPILGKSMSQYAAYAPFAIVVLLIVALAYNAYFFVKKVRGVPQKQSAKADQGEENELIQEEFKKLNLFRQKMVNPMLDKNESPDTLRSCDSPSKLSAQSVRNQLTKMKLQAMDPKQLMTVQYDSIFKDYEDDQQI